MGPHLDDFPVGELDVSGEAQAPDNGQVGFKGIISSNWSLLNPEGPPT